MFEVTAGLIFIIILSGCYLQCIINSLKGNPKPWIVIEKTDPKLEQRVHLLEQYIFRTPPNTNLPIR